MKKLLIVIIGLILLTTVDIKSKNNYSYLNQDNSYNLYRITIDNLNTKNILKYQDKLNITTIYPEINPIYKDQIGKIAYQIKTKNLKEEIEQFKTQYLKLIKKNNYSDYNYLYTNGINIKSIDVYMNSKDLYEFLNNNNATVVDKINHLY